jgi:hypothetical protein
MTSWKRPVYTWTDPVIDTLLAELVEKLPANFTDDARDAYCQDYLATIHEKYPDKVQIRGKAHLRVVK